MAFSISDFCKTEYYMSWDADTIPLREIAFFDDDHPIFDMKTEYHKPYFDTINELFGFGKISDSSFISEHMIFNSVIMRELINNISKSKVSGDSWVDKIINATNFEKAKRSEMFSEFETYGTFCMYHYPDLYRMRHLNTLRGGGFICGRFINNKLLRSLSWDLDTISFELSSCPPFPMSIFHRMYRYWVKYKIWVINKKYK